MTVALLTEANHPPIAQDPFGTRPLFYAMEDQQCLFASSPSDLLPHLREPKIDEARLIRYFQNSLSLSHELSAQTYYKNIYRVLPGHTLTIKDGKAIQKRHWQLDPNAPTIHLANDQAYLDQFDELIKAAVKDCTEGCDAVAAELSGGFDSSLIAIAAHEQGIPIETFTHFDASQAERYTPIRQLLERYPSQKHHCISAENFDALSAFDTSRGAFGGMPPYIFPMFAQPIHQAVQNSGAKILLSGFGGDECVSSIAYSWRREYARLRQYRQLLTGFPKGANLKRKTLLLLEACSPKLYRGLMKALGKYQFRQQVLHQSRNYPSVRAYEIDALMAPHIAYRIECSAIIAQKMGFEYRYPLLNEKLVDWCNRLPLEQKVRLGEKRFLARQLLKQKLGKDWTLQSKMDLEIFPATMTQFQKEYDQGKYNTAFSNLSLMKHAPKGLDEFHIMLAKIFAYQCEGLI